MALVNTYVDPNVNADFITMATRSRNVNTGSGVPILHFENSFTTGTADNILSVYRFFKNVDANFVPREIWIGTYGTQTSLAVSVGIWRVNGSLITAPASGGSTILMGATAIATAALWTAHTYNGLSALYATTGQAPTAFNANRLFELAGDSLVDGGAAPYGNPRQYDICMQVTTANSGGAAGTIVMVMEGYMG
jgi:hypothetical protein